MRSDGIALRIGWFFRIDHDWRFLPGSEWRFPPDANTRSIQICPHPHVVIFARPEEYDGKDLAAVAPWDEKI